MKRPFFTIIVVSYNPGKKLIETIESIKRQSYTNYRILVKDGMSTDGSVDKLKAKFEVTDDFEESKDKILLMESCDSGIYHGMNIATSYLAEKASDIQAGESPSYIFFLNCGDTFKDENVLRNVHEFITKNQSKEGTTLSSIYYGDIFEITTGTKVASNPKIDDYACYRNVPSHQACFYDERLIYKNPFDLRYKVRADYEQFLRCFYREKAVPVYMPVIISNYEGGGYSDQNKKISEDERREIIKLYLTGAQIRKYDLLRVLTLSRLRTFVASNKVTAGGYNAIKNAVYKVRSGKKEK
ncbi:MAG: glycosyltransferase [Butyrivibrio sp.]|nr:glycosyltransferase [Butyrivibrio sp.]